jgi:hypothetical protein
MNTPANIKITEIIIADVKRSLSAIPQKVATIGIRYVTIDPKTGEVSRIST